MGVLKQQLEGSWAGFGWITLVILPDKTGSGRAVFLPCTGCVVGKDGGSKELWELPEDCFGLGWTWIANSMGNKWRTRAGLNPCSGKNRLNTNRTPLAI